MQHWSITFSIAYELGREHVGNLYSNKTPPCIRNISYTHSSSYSYSYNDLSILEAFSLNMETFWMYSLSIQGFEREKDRNRGKFIGSNLVIFCYKSISQSEVISLVYFELMESGHVKINLIFHNGNTFKM